MATLALEYDSAGDVELIWERGALAEKIIPPMFDFGPLSVMTDSVRLRVSSTKLISSSRYFQTMLESSAFREGTDLKEHGSTTIRLSGPEDDPTALMIIIGLLHDGNVSPSKTIDLPLLDKIATLVDKYEWHSVVNPHVTNWFAELKLREGLPETFNDKLLKWLWILWVFGLKTHFKTLSKVAQQDASSPIDLEDENVHLPNSVLRAINDQREEAFRKVSKVLEAYKNRLKGDAKATDTRSDSGSISFMRYSMQLGCAILQGERLGLKNPDYTGVSVRSLRDQIACMVDERDFDILGPGNKRQWSNWPPLRTKDHLSKCLEELKIDEWGLDYDNFKPPPASKHLETLNGIE